MKNKKLLILLGIICIIVIAILIILIKNVLGEKDSINIPFNKDEFLGAVEVKAEPNFILYINEKEKVSNIIFLNKKSVELLSNKGIEGKNIEQAVKKIVDIMKNNNSFSNNSFTLVDYGNSTVFNTVQTEMNKEFVIYGISQEITIENSNFQNKLEELNIKKQKTDSSSMEQLYYYSQELLQK